MNRSRPVTVIALCVLLFCGCTATRRVSQFERLAGAGKEYADALVALTDEAGKVAVDANSQILLFIRDDLNSQELRTEEFQAHTDTLQALLGELHLLREHTLLLKRYFTALFDLASSKAPSEAGTKASLLASQLQALHPRLENARVGDAPVGDFVGDAVPLAVAAFRQRALETELKKSGTVIERELDLQRAFLEALSAGMRDDLETIARIRGIAEVARPYVRDGRVPSGWMKDRQQVLLTSDAVASVDNAAEAAGHLRSTFVALAENRAEAAEFGELFVDIEAMLDLLERIRSVRKAEDEP